MKKLLTLIMMFMIAGSASAAMLLEDTFDYVAGEYLRDQPDWSSNGATVEFVITAGSLEYTGLEPSAGNQVQLYGPIASPAGTRKRITFDDTGRLDGEAVYVSLLLKVGDVGTLSTGNSRFVCYYRASYFNGISIRQNSGDANKFDIGIGENIDDSPQNLVWDDNGGSGYSEGDTILVVYGVDDVGTSGASDLKCWINPTSLGGTAPATTMTTKARSAIGETLFRLGCGNGATVYVDELRIGESYADVTPSGVVPATGTVFIIK